METLTVYKNLDPDQPVTFRGRKVSTVLKKLSDYIDKHEESAADGLTVFWDFDRCDGQDGPQGSFLVWGVWYEGWQIEHDDDPANPDCFDTFSEARDKFVKLAKDRGEWS